MKAAERAGEKLAGEATPNGEELGQNRHRHFVRGLGAD
jgi:hypothetical protein